MTNDFRKAYLWHIETHNARKADIVSRTGVSRDVLNKLQSRPNSTTTVENGMLIAAYFGKTVNQFVQCKDVLPSETLANLFDMLEPEEQKLLSAQILGLVSAN